MDTFLVTLNSLCTAIAALIPSTGSLLDRRFRGFRKIKMRGWLTLVFASASIGLTVYQSNRSKKESDKKESDAKIEQSRREAQLKLRYDSSLIEMKKKFDTSNVNTVKTVSETLGKYGFKLDSTSNRLVKVVRDSSKTKIIEGASPVLVICPRTGLSLKSKSKKEYIYNISLCSSDASSTGFRLLFRSAHLDSLGGLQYGDTHPIISENIQIPANNQYDTYYGYAAKPNVNLAIAKEYLYITGTYTNADKSKVFSVDQVYLYDHGDRSFMILANEERNRIINFIKSKYDQVQKLNK